MIELELTLYAVLLIAIPLSVSILIFWFVRKRNYSSKYQWLALLPMLFLIYGLYLGLVKPYDLYQRHFKEITGLELPSTTEFLDYTDWGYGTTPGDNSSLFYIKVEPDFYNHLKSELNPTSERLLKIDEDLAFRFHEMFGQDFESKVDLQLSDYNNGQELVSIVCFFETEKSLLVFYRGD